MDETMTTTTFELPGYRVVETLGLVRGVTVRSRSLFGTIGAKVETLFGGHISMLTSLCERARGRLRHSAGARPEGRRQRGGGHPL